MHVKFEFGKILKETILQLAELQRELIHQEQRAEIYKRLSEEQNQQFIHGRLYQD